MKRLLPFLCFALCFGYSYADFVDIATVKINGQLVRKLTRNSPSPYHICLKEYNVNDTLTIDVWTDTGRERLAFLTYTNKASGHKDSTYLKRGILITEDMILHPHVFTVVYLYEGREKITASSWDIFETTLNPQIEKVYNQLNQFVDSLKNGGNIDAFMGDSVLINYTVSFSNQYVNRKRLDSAVFYYSNVTSYLILKEEEMEYLKGFNAKDYVQLYNLSTRMYGRLNINSNNLKSFSLRLSNYSEDITFEFSFEDHRYKLVSVII